MCFMRYNRWGHKARIGRCKNTNNFLNREDNNPRADARGSEVVGMGNGEGGIFAEGKGNRDSGKSKSLAEEGRGF